MKQILNDTCFPSTWSKLSMTKLFEVGVFMEKFTHLKDKTKNN